MGDRGLNTDTVTNHTILLEGESMAYIRISKPKDGLVDVEFDDCKGVTRYRDRRRGVRREDLSEVLTAMGDEYHSIRNDIKARRKAARKG